MHFQNYLWHNTIFVHRQGSVIMDARVQFSTSQNLITVRDTILNSANPSLAQLVIDPTSVTVGEYMIQSFKSVFVLFLLLFLVKLTPLLLFNKKAIRAFFKKNVYFYSPLSNKYCDYSSPGNKCYHCNKYYR